jgi:hypothetical protein
VGVAIREVNHAMVERQKKDKDDKKKKKAQSKARVQLDQGKRHQGLEEEEDEEEEDEVVRRREPMAPHRPSHGRI